MDTLLLQDWTTIGAASGATIVQAAPEWLDLEEYQDVVVWIELKSTISSFEIQTSPARDPRLFLPIARQQGSGTGVYVLQVGDSPMFSNSPAQLARWLRWSVSGTGTNWTLTFRVTVMANRQGRG